MWRDEALEIIGCSFNTLRRYVKQGMIRYTDMPNGKRMYWDADVYAMVGKRLERENWCVLYARVNKRDSEAVAQMEKQKLRAYEWAVVRGMKIDKVYEEWGSGTRFETTERPALHILLQEVFQKKVGVVVVESLDRLARVGGSLFREMFKYFGVELVVINEVIKDPYYQSEQADDLAWILEQAGVSRLDKLEGERKRPPSKGEAAIEHPGEITPDWEGAEPGAKPKYNDHKHRLRKSHFKKMQERPQGGEHDLYDPKKEGPEDKGNDKGLADMM